MCRGDAHACRVHCEALRVDVNTRSCLALAIVLIGATAAAEQPAQLKFSNPPQHGDTAVPVAVAFAIEGDSLLARFKVSATDIYAKRELARDEYPYEFDVVELFIRNASSADPTYYEFEVSPYNQSLQVNVVEPRRQYHFGVKNGFTHEARIVAGGWEAEMRIPLATLGWNGTEPLRLIGNAYAALGANERRVYWSLFELPPGKPDFHVPSAFRPLFPQSYSR
jgi:hypothetical protein